MSRQIKWKRIGTGIMAAVLLLSTLTLTGCGSNQNAGGTSGVTAEESVQAAYAVYPQFQDQKVTKSNHTLTLSNQKNNQFAFVYTLAKAGKTLYTSQKIQPGKEENWDILKYCSDSGDLDIIITAWPLEDGTEQNSVTQTIQLTMEE